MASCVPLQRRILGILRVGSFISDRLLPDFLAKHTGSKPPRPPCKLWPIQRCPPISKFTPQFGFSIYWQTAVHVVCIPFGIPQITAYLKAGSHVDVLLRYLQQAAAQAGGKPRVAVAHADGGALPLAQGVGHPGHQGPRSQLPLHGNQWGLGFTADSVGNRPWPIPRERGVSDKGSLSMEQGGKGCGAVPKLSEQRIANDVNPLQVKIRGQDSLPTAFSKANHSRQGYRV